MTKSSTEWSDIRKAFVAARDPLRERYDQKKIIHALIPSITQTDVENERPSDELLKERIARKRVDKAISASRRNHSPQNCNLPGFEDWICGELVPIDGWLIPCGQLLPEEQAYLARRAASGAQDSLRDAERQEARRIAHEGWAVRQQAKGRLRFELTQYNFLFEEGHLLAVEAEADEQL